MHKYYILDGKIAKQCNSLLEWGEWMEKNDRHVAQDEIDGIVISTVFLGLNHNFWDKGDPLLFETMVFLPDDWGGIEQERYFTWEEAEAGHKKMVDAVNQKLIESDLRAAAALSNLQLVSGNQPET